MDVARLPLFKVIKAARTSPLAAMDLIPAGVSLGRIGFGVPLVVAPQFASANEVLVSDAASYRKPWVVRQVIEDGLGSNLFTTDGDAWLARRQPCAQVFRVQNMPDLAMTMAETVTETTEKWTDGAVDIQAAMTDLTVRVALRGLLGANAETGELANQVRHEFEEILDWIAFRFNRPTSPPAIVPTARNRRLKAAKGNLRNAISRLIELRRGHDDGSVDVLSQLVRAQRDKTHDLSDQAILDECIGFMFAGHDTTASTLSWALYELSTRPELQDALAGEGSTLRMTPETILEDVQSMDQTAAVVEETLRMYPAGISIARSAKRTTQIAGEKIRRGTMVVIPVYAMQRSPLVWDRPDEFDPTRDHAGNGEGFLPFGLGPRRCLGARFARTELNIAIGLICNAWHLRYEQDGPPKPIVAPSLRAEGELKLTLTSRR